MWSYIARGGDNFFTIEGWGTSAPYTKIHCADYIYPFSFLDDTYWYLPNTYKGYDITEFILYVFTPAVLYFLYRYIKGEKVGELP